MEYLGATLAVDGQSRYELNRRIGLAKADFISLSKVWSHSSLTWRRKLRVFTSVVESKLFYALSSMCFTVADLRRLDGFQNRCIRKIVGIPVAYVSRISNKEVLARAGHRAVSDTLRKRRLELYGKVVRSAVDHPMRQVCFIGGTTLPATDLYVRRVGRPCKEWVREAQSDACTLFGSLGVAERSASDQSARDAALRDRLGF